MPDSITLSDQILLRKAVRGDELAFTQLYHRYSSKIYTFALRILNSEMLAEEVMHETMLKVWQMGGKGDDVNNLEAYLRTSTRNASLNMLRKQELERRIHLDQVSDWTELHEDTEERILLNDAKRILEEAIQLLPPQQQQVFRLCHIQGLKYEEVAVNMGLSPHTVAVHMKLALRFVRSYVRKATDILAILVIFRLY